MKYNKTIKYQNVDIIQIGNRDYNVLIGTLESHLSTFVLVFLALENVQFQFMRRRNEDI